MNEKEIKQTPSRSSKKPSKKKLPFSGFFQLFFKQIFTTTICAVLVLTAHFTGKQPFCGYTKALGSAIRYEVNTDGFKESGSAIWEWLLNRFSKETEGNENEET